MFTMQKGQYKNMTVPPTGHSTSYHLRSYNLTLQISEKFGEVQQSFTVTMPFFPLSVQ
jgi:hypothetical protein